MGHAHRQQTTMSTTTMTAIMTCDDGDGDVDGNIDGNVDDSGAQPNTGVLEWAEQTVSDRDKAPEDAEGQGQWSRQPRLCTVPVLP